MTKIDLNPTYIFIVGTVWAALWAGLGWWANHKLSTARDRIARENVLEDARNDRKRHFRGFMSGFRSWVERTEPSKAGDDFSDRVHEFRVETAKIMDDFPPDRKTVFDARVTTLCRLNAAEVSSMEITERNNRGGIATAHYFGRIRLTEAIDSVLQTVD